jgi:uncharacterized membrane protein
MSEEKITADRLAAYSDAVFAVIVTIYGVAPAVCDSMDSRTRLASSPMVFYAGYLYVSTLHTISSSTECWPAPT